MGTFERRLAERRSVRLREYDYSSAGAYFFTACVRDRKACLGEIADDEVRLWMEGQMIREVWDSLEERFPGVTTDAFVVMPNHVHGLVVMEVETGSPAAEQVVGKGAGAITRAPTPLGLNAPREAGRAPTLG